MVVDDPRVENYDDDWPGWVPKRGDACRLYTSWGGGGWVEGEVVQKYTKRRRVTVRFGVGWPSSPQWRPGLDVHEIPATWQKTVGWDDETRIGPPVNYVYSDWFACQPEAAPKWEDASSPRSGKKKKRCLWPSPGGTPCSKILGSKSSIARHHRSIHLEEKKFSCDVVEPRKVVSLVCSSMWHVVGGCSACCSAVMTPCGRKFSRKEDADAHIAHHRWVVERGGLLALQPRRYNPPTCGACGGVGKKHPSDILGVPGVCSAVFARRRAA